MFQKSKNLKIRPYLETLTLNAKNPTLNPQKPNIQTHIMIVLNPNPKKKNQTLSI
jgi:hypothetical protein